MRTLLALGLATAMGLMADRFKIPGGALVGALIGAAVVSLTASPQAASLPKPVVTGALIVLGCSIGADVNAGTLTALRGLVAPALLSGVLLIVAGVGIALLLGRIGIAPRDAVLATSPGGLSALAGIAATTQGAAVPVVLFHVVRLVMVVVTLPAISRLQ